MRIGVDFDNTIISYDQLFYKIACEKRLVPENIPANKGAVRDYFREHGQEGIWTEMQGYVYGKRLAEAEFFSGVVAFFIFCKDSGIPVFIVSHKTHYPYAGEKYDLHKAAYNWLKKKNFFCVKGIGFNDRDLYFELSKKEKIDRIVSLKCTHFIDDLPEFLSSLGRRKNLKRILFDPWGKYQKTDMEIEHCTSWEKVLSFVHNKNRSNHSF